MVCVCLARKIRCYHSPTCFLFVLRVMPATFEDDDVEDATLVLLRAIKEHSGQSTLVQHAFLALANLTHMSSGYKCNERHITLYAFSTAFCIQYCLIGLFSRCNMNRGTFCWLFLVLPRVFSTLLPANLHVQWIQRQERHFSLWLKSCLANWTGHIKAICFQYCLTQCKGCKGHVKGFMCSVLFDTV